VARDTLLDLFEDFSHLDDVFVVHDDGYRVRQQTYREISDAARRFARELNAHGIGPGENVVIWSENRSEWIVALWGTLLAGAVLVPVDYRASGDLLSRIATIVSARLILVGTEVKPPANLVGEVRPLSHIGQASDAHTSQPEPSDGDQGRTSTANHQSSVQSTTLAEIIFTSGATADPKGVTITHRNILANLIPIEREIARYKRYERPFHPLRFLNLLPLSHMFGQSMATFIPPLLSGTVVFSHSYSPNDIVRLVRSRRVSVLVCVPKVLSMLREYVERELPEASAPDVLAGRHWLWRWWHYRRIHRLFGWKFWCIVCGAAPLDSELEAFWRKLGFAVVQGYGLTETAPIVTLNHPFRSAQGSVGRPIAGVDVRIAEDGEILVRGDNVTSGYYGTAATGEAFQDGWFHTGDIGEVDSSGRLTIKGRKKEMIVTPQGLNVFPEDVEKVLLAQRGIQEAGVVGVRVGGEERIHAVLIVEPGTDVDAAVRHANAGLEDHQRVRSTSIWPGPTLPRTEGTLKLKRRELHRWASGEQTGVDARPAAAVSVADVVTRYAVGRTVDPNTTLEELGLSSLDRVELMMALEEAFHVTLDESVFASAKTIGELEAIVGPERPYGSSLALGSGSQAPAAQVPEQTRTVPAAPIAFPSWNRSWPAWALRRISLPTWILPFMGAFMDLSVEGLEHVNSIEGPVIFASNHQSHLDTPAIFIALPPSRRYRLAPAMAKEFFAAHFNRAGVSFREWLGNSANYYLASEFFAAFPLPQREAGTRQTMRYIGEVVGDGYSILIFPEGRRTGAEIGPFRPGVGMIAARLGVPVIPVRLSGLERVMPAGSLSPVRGPVRVTFGAPLHLEGSDYAALAKRVEEAVKALK
jgi:long-chain acyl-CoA synthetase